MSTATATKRKLTPKQERQQEQFCLEYVIDFNGAQAAIRAGYSKRSAKEQASRLLTHAHIQARITELTLERQKRARKNGDDVIRELENIGFSRLNNIVEFNESGMQFVSRSDEIDDDAMAALESVEVTEIISKTDDGNDMLKTKVKLSAKVPALNLLAKHHNLLNENKMDVNHTGDITLNVVDYSKKKSEKGKQ